MKVEVPKDGSTPPRRSDLGANARDAGDEDQLADHVRAGVAAHARHEVRLGHDGW